MGRRSSLDALPAEIADVCHRLIREGRTIHEITDALNALDADVSKSAVGRYVKSAREQMQRYRDAQEVAGRWAEKLGEDGKGDVATLLHQMLTGIAFTTLDQVSEAQLAEGEPNAKPAKPLKPMDLMLLAKALESMEASKKRGIERQEKAARAAIERAADKAGEVGQRVGLSQATIDEIQRELRLL